MSDPPAVVPESPLPARDGSSSLEPGIRAARHRLGMAERGRPLSQREAAERCGVPFASFVRWDQGKSQPRDAETLQLLSIGLQTPLEVLFPPERNPHVAVALRRLRAQTTEREGTAEEPTATATGAPPRAPIPDIGDVLQTIDGPGGTRRPRFAGGHLAAVAAALVIVVAAVLVVMSGGGDDRAPATAAITTRSPSTNTVDAARRARAAEMTAAADRGDYNAAIAAADELNDPAAARYRAAAATVLVRRAAAAAKRGDLSLARQRLRAAKRRYATAPGGAAVEAQIRSIERARAERARAEQATKRRVAARRRASTAAANTQTRTPAPASGQAATPTPTPTQGTAQSSSGSASKSSSEKKSDCGNGCGLGPFP